MEFMKKVWDYLRSMRFGMLLLCLILLCSLPGSLIQQGSSAEFYLERYSWGRLLLVLNFDHIFSSWYFVSLLALLCLNLFLCSLLRIRNTTRLHAGSKARMENMPAQKTSSEKEAELEILLQKRGFKRLGGESPRRLYAKGTWGFYGSFITHLGLLLTLLFAAAGLYFVQIEDYNLIPGESFALSDGTMVSLEAFSEQDESGRTDYVSAIQVTDRHGNRSDVRKIRVNEPFSFGGHKYYQQNYGQVGAVMISRDGMTDKVKVDGQMFLTLDGTTGIALYGLYAMEEHADAQGNAHGGAAYAIALYRGGEPEMTMAFAGDTYSIGGVEYRFGEPESFSGIRVKTVSPWVLGGLYASFVLLTLGLYLCFFASPAYAFVEEGGYNFWSMKKDVLFERDVARILGKEEGKAA